jgi:hypothetical protein
MVLKPWLFVYHVLPSNLPGVSRMGCRHVSEITLQDYRVPNSVFDAEISKTLLTVLMFLRRTTKIKNKAHCRR